MYIFISYINTHTHAYAHVKSKGTQCTNIPNLIRDISYNDGHTVCTYMKKLGQANECALETKKMLSQNFFGICLKDIRVNTECGK